MPDGSKIPGGLKTGTQQGPLSSADTLETWMNGYSRHAATAVWVGNANNELVLDGPAHGYAAANTTKYLYRNWMAEYHVALQERGVIDAPAEFDPLRPGNVAQVAFNTPATTRGLSGGCDQYATSWIAPMSATRSERESAEIDSRNGLLAGSNTPARFRETRQFVKLPEYKPELAIRLARNFSGGRIRIKPTEASQGGSAVNISSPSDGATISSDTSVIGSVGLRERRRDWTLAVRPGRQPRELAGDRRRQRRGQRRRPWQHFRRRPRTRRLYASACRYRCHRRHTRCLCHDQYPRSGR
ncbi:MAG: hypothetical protein U5Q44_10075 [Dehalococcoidia bacterium]|nr:hypothetical protein [Dehalococcoidia bacterium]